MDLESEEFERMSQVAVEKGRRVLPLHRSVQITRITNVTSRLYTSPRLFDITLSQGYKFQANGDFYNKRDEDVDAKI